MNSGSSASPQPRLLLNPAEAAAALGIGRTTLWTLIGSGAIRTIRISQRAVRIPVTELDAYIAQRLDEQAV